MKILIVFNGTIPSVKYGGTQRVIWYLGKELSQMGHEVTYLVGEGSYCDFAKVLVYNPQLPMEAQIPGDIDIVHFHASPQQISKPFVVTVHGNGAWDLVGENTIYVSRDHALRHGCEAYVYNGLDWDDYGSVNLTKQRKGYHFLGKAAWRVKNVKGAIDIAESLHEPLEVLGGYRFNMKMGMRFTFNPRMHFHGMVDNEAKRFYIEQSKGLLSPVTWHEPFGLAIVESLYWGAPVFGTPYGSFPELVPANVGFLSNSASQWVEHLKDCSYDAAECHAYARDLFNSRIMAEKYVSYYEQVLNGRPLNTPVEVTDKKFKDLEWKA